MILMGDEKTQVNLVEMTLDMLFRQVDCIHRQLDVLEKLWAPTVTHEIVVPRDPTDKVSIK